MAAKKKKRRKKKARRLLVPIGGTEIANRIGKKRRILRPGDSIEGVTVRQHGAPPTERGEVRNLMERLIGPHSRRGALGKKRRGGIGGLSVFEAELVALQSTLKTIRALQVLGLSSQRRVFAAVQAMLDDSE